LICNNDEQFLKPPATYLKQAVLFLGEISSETLGSILATLPFTAKHWAALPCLRPSGQRSAIARSLQEPVLLLFAI
jgi:hypothetical protein